MKTKFSLLVTFLLVAVFEILLSSAAYSQTKWFPIGAEWYYYLSDGYGNFRTNRFVVEKDTIVNEKKCQLICGENNTNILFEENGCVYYFFNDEFRKIYDFNVNVGDTIELEFKTFSNINLREILDSTFIVSCLVEKVTSQIIDGVELKEIWMFYTYDVFVNEDYSFPESGRHIYLEKIGSVIPGMHLSEFIPHILRGITHPAIYRTGLRCYHDSDIEYILALDGNPCDYQSSDTEERNINNDILLFPNPVKDVLTIHIKIEDSQEVLVVIYDATGKIVLEKQHNIPCELNIEHLTSGTYWIQIFNGNICLITNKFIKL